MPQFTFPNTGSIFGPSGSVASASGTFLWADYGIRELSFGTGFFIYSTGLINALQFPNTGSIFGPSGSPASSSGTFLWADYGSFGGGPYLIKSDDAGTGSAPSIISPFKPYAYFFLIK